MTCSVAGSPAYCPVPEVVSLVMTTHCPAAGPVPLVTAIAWPVLATWLRVRLVSAAKLAAACSACARACPKEIVASCSWRVMTVLAVQVAHRRA